MTGVKFSWAKMHFVKKFLRVLKNKHFKVLTDLKDIVSLQQV